MATEKVNEKVVPPASFHLSRQLDQERIDYLTKRVDELLNSNNALRSSSSKNEKDTHDIVLYFQREVEMKDDIINKLNEELVKRETQFKFEQERLKKRYEDDYNNLKAETDGIITDYKLKLDKAENDLKSVDTYLREKDSYDGTIKNLENNMKEQRQQMFDALEDQERKMLEEKANLLRELDEQKLAFREAAFKEAREAMGHEAKKIMAENNRMFEELKFHHATEAELQTEKAQTETQLITVKRDLSILIDKEEEYAKQAYFKSKEIKSLRERVEYLEKQQLVTAEKFRQSVKEYKGKVSKELNQATFDSAGLRQLLRTKNKELRQMKTLAATILSQRTELEQFFLEALNEVKEVIKKERKRNKVESMIELNRKKHPDKSASGPSFPPLNIKATNLHHLDQRGVSSVPLSKDDQVHIKDLNWEDKELVLRVLFAKMNGQTGKANTAINEGTKSRNLHSMPMNPNVFVSEGAGLLPDDGYQGHFELDGESYDEEEGDSGLLLDDEIGGSADEYEEEY